MSSVITKTVIPAAGFGTRMLPAAKAVPKELLPVLDRPTIQYVVEEAAAAGVTDVCLVISPDKPGGKEIALQRNEDMVAIQAPLTVVTHGQDAHQSPSNGREAF